MWGTRFQKLHKSTRKNCTKKSSSNSTLPFSPESQGCSVPNVAVTEQCLFDSLDFVACFYVSSALLPSPIPLSSFKISETLPKPPLLIVFFYYFNDKDSPKGTHAKIKPESPQVISCTQTPALKGPAPLDKHKKAEEKSCLFSLHPFMLQWFAY